MEANVEATLAYKRVVKMEANVEATLAYKRDGGKKGGISVFLLYHNCDKLFVSLARLTLHFQLSTDIWPCRRAKFQQKQAAEEAVHTARTEITKLFNSNASLRPSFLRLAFYDAILHHPIGKVDRPKGSVRLLGKEQEVPSDAIDALEKLRVDNAKVKSYISYADLYQLAGIESIKVISGMEIKFQPGRLDPNVPVPLNELEEFKRVQRGELDVPTIKAIFSRLGFDDKEVVALFSAIIYWRNPTLFTTNNVQLHVNLWSIYEKLIEDYKTRDIPRLHDILSTHQDNQANIGSKKYTNPQSSTVVRSIREGVQVQTTITTTNNSLEWKFLVEDSMFRKHVDTFSKDHDQFAMTYIAAHQKLANLGVQYFPKLSEVERIEYHDMKHGIVFAVAMTIIVGVMGFFYETLQS
ncbi:hypothetical protein L7F22_038768 [Adiantum nelumboides]|nr:hypothetical protein [Adiantum nelumboides]